VRDSIPAKGALPIADLLHASVTGLFQVFAWPTFGLMLIGMLLGFVVGLLPGLGGPTTLALMLPFVFKMTPIEAFAFLLGMLAVTATTGDITSILFGIPGEPTTAATIVDGHAMAKNGEAGRALGAAMMSSLMGALFGALGLGLTIPLVRPLVLTLGSAEFFMLALLGITFVAALSGEALVKGLLAGGLGLWLATIGLNPVTGTQRYTFGQLFLWDGIGLVPVTIGFYAVPELIEMAIAGTSIAKVDVGRVGGVWQGVRDSLRHWLLVIRCSALGTFVSIIPGLGAATTQWLAYAHAVQSAPGRERFGRGAVEGVLGPGAANNASLGGSLVTTVAFGVPASVATAILMGAFFIQGLVPGPSMLTPAPRGHLAVTMSMVWTIVVANLITVLVCLLFMSPLARITRIRATLLVPFIMVLIYVGAFAEKNVFEDLGVVLAFGALGWVMAHLDWPRPPLLLGLVLGPLAENRLFLATDNYGVAWLLRPGVLVIAGVIAIGLAVPMMRSRRLQTAPAAAAAPAPAGRGWRLDAATAFDMCLVLLFAAALWESRRFDIRAGLFPWTITSASLLLAVIHLARGLRAPRRRAEDAGDHGTSATPPRPARRRTLAMCGWILGMYAAIWLLGFSVATLLTAFLYLRAARERWPVCIAVSLVGFAFVYGLFETGLGVPFPPGRLFVWLGDGS
jgi:putative tricarboxylic transport membrane protein